ncbi:ABC transporter ATP-binding protein [Agarivorans sp. TSD2052]|uniref:ABC transporter ATP-binding protein n=1 Tax=Agarivorans sp. TSD2052 TaxID=2937286 RepID=UPI00200E0674|nr:ABC transporter ATP-binding protein [Agarivorans sp. TSD2052]UPW17912.1 ABC transporter ATP-binding protein [Agarivorans sp. TSD2052]
MSIVLRQVNHFYGEQQALKDINIEVEENQIVALLGPSGCGKTTLLRLIAGLERLQSGELYLQEALVASPATGTHLPPEQRAIGMMFQDYALFPHMSVRANIEYGLRKQQNIAQRRQWIEDSIDSMGMQGLLERYPHTLSGGQQQRVALLRALAPEPNTMLLDEPFSALDEHLRQQVREETLDILKKSNTPAVMVTHDPLEAMFIADRIVVMEQGRIVQNACPQDIYLHPENAFVAALFGPSNRFVAKVKAGSVMTPLGEITVKHIADDHPVEVIIRAKDVVVHQLENSELVEATVISVHAMGNETHFRLQLATMPERVVHARMRDHWQAMSGTKVWLSVEKDAAFIFPKS